MSGSITELLALPAFLTKPEPRLDALPTEIWDNIMGSRQGAGTDEDPTIITSSDLINLRLVNRTMYVKIEADFGSKLFTTVKFMITPWSLHIMHKIADSKYGQFVQEVVFGPERMNPGLAYAGLTNYLSLPTSMDGRRWSRAVYEQWKKRYVTLSGKVLAKEGAVLLGCLLVCLCSEQ